MFEKDRSQSEVRHIQSQSRIDVKEGDVSNGKESSTMSCYRIVD